MQRVVKRIGIYEFLLIAISRLRISCVYIALKHRHFIGLLEIFGASIDIGCLFYRK